MIYHLGNQMAHGQRPRIFEYGQQKRDHIYIRDVVDATIKAFSTGISGVYNIGTGVATSFNDLVDIINSTLGTALEPIFIPNPYTETYQNNTQAENSRAAESLGFRRISTPKRPSGP